MAQLEKTTENNSLLMPKGPFIYYVSTELDGWVRKLGTQNSEIGPFCLVTNNAYIVVGWLETPITCLRNI